MHHRRCTYIHRNTHTHSCVYTHAPVRSRNSGCRRHAVLTRGCVPIVLNIVVASTNFGDVCIRKKAQLYRTFFRPPSLFSWYKYIQYLKKKRDPCVVWSHAWRITVELPVFPLFLSDCSHGSFHRGSKEASQSARGEASSPHISHPKN